MRKTVKLKWILLLIVLAFQNRANANIEKLPKTKSDWMVFECYKFSGNSSGYNYYGDIYFKRNGVEIDIKNEHVIFKKNAFFETDKSTVKLEQNKLIVSTAEELSSLKYKADGVVKTNNKLILTGNVQLIFPNKSTFKAHEIIVGNNEL